jgi:hypothetical protein
MTRRILFALPLALTACHSPAAPMDVFPETIGPWKRASLRDLAISDAPDPISRSSVRRAQLATYEGPAKGKLQARAYELSSPQAGVDLAQRWRPSADTVFFWATNYFVVVKWDEADRASLQQFTQTLAKRLNPK